MSDVILNLLPLDEGRRARFLAAAPGVEQIFAPAFGTYEPPRAPTEDELARATIILGSAQISDVARAPALRWLQTWSAGVDQYLAPGAFPAGAALTCATGAYDQTVAEHMLAMTLALCRKLPLYRDNQNAGQWKTLGRMKSIRGATVLIVGAGSIGSTFGALCQALGARTVGLRRTVGAAPQAGLDEVHAMDQLEHWLPLADVVALVLPHAPETVHLMDERRLGLLREGAILLNAGRGTAVDLDALLPLLRSRRLWGAALDVTEPEPLPPGHPLWAEPGALITPHVAGGFYLAGTLDRVIEIALDNLGRYLAGQPLKNRKK